MIKLREATASQEIPLGYFLDTTDGDTGETGLTIANTDIKLWKTGATTLANKNSGGATHISAGIYYAVLDDTDSDTVGPMVIFIHVAGALTVRLECEVLPANIYDSLFGSDKLQVDQVQLGGDTQSATDLKDFADTGYDPGTNKVQGVVLTDTATTLTNQLISALAAANLEDTFDGTGYLDGAAPARQDQLAAVAGGLALQATADAFTKTQGTETNTYTATRTHDGVSHRITDSGAGVGIDGYYTMNTGAADAFPVLLHGHLYYSNGGAPTDDETVALQMLNFPDSVIAASDVWETIDTLTHDTADEEINIFLNVNYVSGGTYDSSAAGDVRIRLLHSATEASSFASVEHLVVNYLPSGLTAAEVWTYVTRVLTAATNITDDDAVVVQQTGDSYAVVTALNDFDPANDAVATVATVTDGAKNATVAKEATLAALNDIAVSDILGGNVDGSVDVQGALTACLAYAAGKTDGADTATLIYKRQDGSTAAITMTVDAVGERSVVVLDLT